MKTAKTVWDHDYFQVTRGGRTVFYLTREQIEDLCHAGGGGLYSPDMFLYDILPNYAEAGDIGYPELDKLRTWAVEIYAGVVYGALDGLGYNDDPDDDGPDDDDTPDDPDFVPDDGFDWDAPAPVDSADPAPDTDPAPVTEYVPGTIPVTYTETAVDFTLYAGDDAQLIAYSVDVAELALDSKKHMVPAHQFIVDVFNAYRKLPTEDELKLEPDSRLRALYAFQVWALSVWAGVADARLANLGEYGPRG